MQEEVRGYLFWKQGNLQLLDKPMLVDSRVPGILKQIYYRDGFKGLFRGLTPRMAKIGPSCAIMISSYEMGKTFFSNQHNN